jgi:hypothetical protein
MDLAEFQPSWADDSNPETDEGDEAGGDKKAKPRKNKLDMVRWIAAFQSFALAADAAEVCTS